MSKKEINITITTDDAIQVLGRVGMRSVDPGMCILID